MQDKGRPVIVPFWEHVPPDPGAAFNWLKNRRSDQWRDKLPTGDLSVGGLGGRRRFVKQMYEPSIVDHVRAPGIGRAPVDRGSGGD